LNIHAPARQNVICNSGCIAWKSMCEWVFTHLSSVCMRLGEIHNLHQFPQFTCACQLSRVYISMFSFNHYLCILIFTSFSWTCSVSTIYLSVFILDSLTWACVVTMVFLGMLSFKKIL
jgi:hypothetical protein